MYSKKMFLFALLLNFLTSSVTCGRRFESKRRNAGISKVTKTFGNGVATFIKDLKEGNWGEQTFQQFNERKDNRFLDKNKYYSSIGDDTLFYVIVIIMTALIVCGILYFIIKILPNMQHKDTQDELRRRCAARLRVYDHLKFVSDHGYIPDKTFKNLQKIEHH